MARQLTAPPVHRHRECEWRWTERFGAGAAAASAKGVPFHGECDRARSHIINAICSCGALRYYCNTGEVGWLTPDAP